MVHNILYWSTCIISLGAMFGIIYVLAKAIFKHEQHLKMYDKIDAEIQAGMRGDKCENQL